jgi:hypothetical protein
MFNISDYNKRVWLRTIKYFLLAWLGLILSVILLIYVSQTIGIGIFSIFVGTFIVSYLIAKDVIDYEDTEEEYKKIKY